MAIITFEDYRPVPREAPLSTPWTLIRVDYNPDELLPDDGWQEGVPFAVPVLDDDPRFPQPQSFSIASVGPGSYRPVFLDAAGNEDITDPPVLWPPVVLQWRPSVDDVAQVLPAYTRHDIDGDGDAAGAEHGTFDDETSPTADEVEGFIDTAVREIAGRCGIGQAALNAYADLARQTAIWHAAATIEAEKAPEGGMDSEGPARWKQSSYVASLKDLKDAIPQAIRLS